MATFRQSGQVGDERGVRQVVKILKDDDHLREVRHLYREVVEKGIAQPLSVQRGERADVDEDGVYLGQPVEESSTESHGVVVARDDVEPDKVQFGMRSGPLGEKDDFPAPAGATMRAML